MEDLQKNSRPENNDLDFEMVNESREIMETELTDTLLEIVDKKRTELPVGVADKLIRDKIIEIERNPLYKDLKRPKLAYVITNEQIDPTNISMDFDYPSLELQEYILDDLDNMTDEVSP